LVYVFTAPGIEEEQVSDGMELAIEILQEFGKGEDAWWKIFRP